MGWIPRTVLNYKLHYTPPILMSILVTACIILIFDISDHTMQDISIFSIEIDIISNLSIQGGTSNHISSINDSKSFTVIMLSTLFTQLVLSAAWTGDRSPSHIGMSCSHSFRNFNRSSCRIFRITIARNIRTIQCIAS